jgi:uncharacterized membrane protein
MTWAPVFALTAALGFAVAGVFLKRGLQYATPFTAAVVSVTFTTTFVWMVAVATAPLAQFFSWRILPFLAAGLAAPGLARLVLFLGVHRIGVARAASLASTAPLLAVALAILMLGERPSPWLLAGTAAIVVGGALLSSRAGTDGSWRRRDVILPLLAALGFAVRDTISRYGFREPVHPLVAAAAATLTSLTVMGVFAATWRRHLGVGRAGLGFMALSGLAEAIAYLTMWRALATADVSLISPLVNAQSIFAVVLAALFLRDLERVTWRIALAAGLIVVGVATVVRFGTN